MLRFTAGAVAALLFVLAGFFVWTSLARNETQLPQPPVQASLPRPPLVVPPQASEKTKEEKRFARTDKDKDGRITRAEMLMPRRKAFAKLDTSGDGQLSFEEWAISTSEKFAKADADHSGWLSPKEYETTKAKPAPKRKSCTC